MTTQTQNKTAQWIAGEGQIERGKYKVPFGQIAPRALLQAIVLEHNDVVQQRDELLNEVSNLKHDYAIVSAQRNKLLAACKAAHDCLDAIAREHGLADEDFNTLSKVEAAIQKAEGAR